jgi:hypothetical protein
MEKIMFFKKDEPIAQFADRFLKWVAFAVTLMSVSYGAAAISNFLEGDAFTIADTTRNIFGLTAAALILPQFINLIRLRLRMKSECKSEPEGFIAEAYSKSAVGAFAAGFVSLVAMEPFAAKVFSDLPPAFFIQAALSLMMAVLGVSFFIQYHGSGDDLDDEFEDEGPDA